MQKCIDYTADFTEAESNNPVAKPIACYGSGRTLLKLFKLDTPIQRLDGRRVGYELISAELSVDTKEPSDKAWIRVWSDDSTYWSKRELEEIGYRITSSGKTRNEPCDVFNNVIIFN